VISDLTLPDSEVLFTVGSICSQLFIAVTVHLLLVFPTGRFQSRIDRLTAAAAYFAAGPLYMTAFVFADPASYGCGACPDNTFLVADNKGLADSLAVAADVIFALVALGSLISLARRWHRANAVQRRALAAVPVRRGGPAVAAVRGDHHRAPGRRRFDRGRRNPDRRAGPGSSPTCCWPACSGRG
jgi:hypothetical protein